MGILKDKKLIDQAHENGKYLTFAFDLDVKATIDGYKLLKNILANIQKIEKEKATSILHLSEIYDIEPDTNRTIYSFTVHADKIDATTIYRIFAVEKDHFETIREFRASHEYYETDSDLESNKKFCRKDCLNYLRHKISEK